MDPEHELVVDEAVVQEATRGRRSASTSEPAFADSIRCIVSRTDCERSEGPHSRTAIRVSATFVMALPFLSRAAPCSISLLSR
jgi:hypothetical protein